MLSIIVAGAMIASTSTVYAATTKPTPKPTVKATAKARAKTTAKPSAKATPKSTKKAIAKKPAAKRAAPKKSTPRKTTVYKRKVVKVAPSPSPKWPPTSFNNPNNGEIFYKIPTGKELLGELSAAYALATQVKVCAKFACGAVKIASTKGCKWWGIDSTVLGPLSATDPSMVPYGTLRTTATGTDPKQIVTVFLISSEPLKPNVSVSRINISCYHSPVAEKIPTNVYTPNAPTPSETPTTNTN